MIFNLPQETNEYVHTEDCPRMSVSAFIVAKMEMPRNRWTVKQIVTHLYNGIHSKK